MKLAENTLAFTLPCSFALSCPPLPLAPPLPFILYPHSTDSSSSLRLSFS